MKDKRILYVSSEVVPYLPETEISSMSFEAPKMVNKQGGQIRIFMPKFGNINERRHQLHEVIRLSGINLVINDFDMPLIIKVASIPKERIQVYFIDNEEYFKRKATLKDENGKLFIIASNKNVDKKFKYIDYWHSDESVSLDCLTNKIGNVTVEKVQKEKRAISSKKRAIG